MCNILRNGQLSDHMHVFTQQPN